MKVPLFKGSARDLSSDPSDSFSARANNEVTHALRTLTECDYFSFFSVEERFSSALLNLFSRDFIKPFHNGRPTTHFAGPSESAISFPSPHTRPGADITSVLFFLNNS